MEINVEKFLALTALMAATAVPACTIEAVDSGDHDSGTGLGAGGSAGATGADAAAADAAAAGSSGSASTEGMADGGAGESASDAGAGCYPDEADDGGVEGLCDTLPYANVTCSDADGGQNEPLGVAACNDYLSQLKPAAARDFLDCLKKLPAPTAGAGGCTASDTAVGNCTDQLFGRASCPVPDAASEDGGVLGCKELVASCPGVEGGAGITMEHCQEWLSPLNAAARETALQCGIAPSSEGVGCADNFESCVFPPL